MRNLDLLDTPATNALIERREDGRRYLDMLRLPDFFNAVTLSDEPVGELRNQVAHLAVEAYRREEISQGRLCEIGRKLRLPAADLLELAEAAKPA